jgi:ABC-2 type transport system ATP-binding protein
MKGDLLLVECEPLGLALDLLQQTPDVADAAVFGNALHVVMPEGKARIARLRTFLSQHGVNVSKIGPIRPTLEDVFVSLTAAQRAVGKV